MEDLDIYQPLLEVVVQNMGMYRLETRIWNLVGARAYNHSGGTERLSNGVQWIEQRNGKIGQQIRQLNRGVH